MRSLRWLLMVLAASIMLALPALAGTRVWEVRFVEAPVLTIPADVTVPMVSVSGTKVNIGTATATDRTDPAPKITNNAPALFLIGDTAVTWTATNRYGISTSAVQLVTVEAPAYNPAAPKLVVPANVTTEQTSAAGATVAIGAASAIDYAGKPLPVTNDAPAVFPAGVTTITWVAVDNLGNVTKQTQTVTVQDTTAPTLTVPANVTVTQTGAAGTAVTLGQATAADAVDAAPTVANNAPALFPVGTTTVTWTARDAAGNARTATQTVTVQRACGLTINKVTLDWKEKGQMLTNPTLALQGSITTPFGAPAGQSTVTVQFTFGGKTNTCAVPVTWSAGGATSFSLNWNLAEGTLPNGSGATTVTLTFPAATQIAPVTAMVECRQAGNHQWKYN